MPSFDGLSHDPARQCATTRPRPGGGRRLMPTGSFRRSSAARSLNARTVEVPRIRSHDDTVTELWRRLAHDLQDLIAIVPAARAGARSGSKSMHEASTLVPRRCVFLHGHDMPQSARPRTPTSGRTRAASPQMPAVAGKDAPSTSRRLGGSGRSGGVEERSDEERPRSTRGSAQY